MSWIIVKRFPLDTDLSLVTGYLRQRNVAHHIYEESGEQIVAVSDPAQVAPVAEFIASVLQGKIHIEQTAKAPPPSSLTSPTVWQQILATPVTSLLILLSALGALVVYTDPQFNAMHWFTFQDYGAQNSIPFADSFFAGQVWRVLTPVFLHSGAMHFIGNSLWVWILGRRLEVLLSRSGFILFVIVTGIASNSAQFFWSGGAIFGGMSGVVYALIGFIMVSQKIAPHRLTTIPPALIGVMLVWLLLCMTGAVGAVMGAGVANAGHLGGLVAGCVYAALFTRRQRTN